MQPSFFNFLFFLFASPFLVFSQGNCPNQISPSDMTNATLFGNGTAASCTEVALKTALGQGGKIKCNCGLNPVTIPISNTITISQNTIFDGSGKVTLSGGNARRIFLKNTNAEFTLQNLKIINGKSTDKGSAIFCHNLPGLQWPAERLRLINVEFENNQCAATTGQDIGGAVYHLQLKELLVSGCIFKNNKGSNGGAITGIGSDLKIANSQFINNLATGEGGFGSAPGGGCGGAIFVDNVNSGLSKKVDICGCRFEGNQGGVEGGAFYAVLWDNGSSAQIDQTTFHNNSLRSTSRGQGGAVYYQIDNIQSNTPAIQDLIISNSTFSSNVCLSQGGGAWILAKGNVGIQNSTFTQNKTTSASSGLGGALVANRGQFDLQNLTIASNRAEFFGAGIFSVRNANTSVKLSNSIISNNSYGFAWIGQCWNGADTNTFIDGGGNVQFPRKRPNGSNDNLCTRSALFQDPLLQLIGKHGGPTETMPISTGSPAINRGSNCISKDQRGASRVGACDAGAFEFNGFVTEAKEIQIHDEITMYPNPAKDWVFIRLPDYLKTNPTTVQIFNTALSMVWEENYNASNMDNDLLIPITSLKSGVYILRIASSESRKSLKLVVQ